MSKPQCGPTCVALSCSMGEPVVIRDSEGHVHNICVMSSLEHTTHAQSARLLAGLLSSSSSWACCPPAILLCSCSVCMMYSPVAMASICGYGVLWPWQARFAERSFNKNYVILQALHPEALLSDDKWVRPPGLQRQQQTRLWRRLRRPQRRAASPPPPPPHPPRRGT